MRKINFKSLIVLLLLGSCLTLFSCGEDKPAVPAEAEQTNEDMLVKLTQKQFAMGQMEVGKMTRKSFNSVIKANGMFDVPPENKSTVSAYFGGYVKQIQLLPGQFISKGQTLFILENPEYIQVQQDFLEAKSQLSYLKQDYERQKDLSKDNVSSQKTYSRAEADYKVTYARYESLKKRLDLMNISPNSITETNIRTTIAVSSPISGYITDVNATKGMYLNPSDVAVTIMNTDHLHLELKIFEQDLLHIQVGQVVRFRLQNDPTEYLGSVYLINKAIDPIKRTVNVHCHLANEVLSKQFTPGMFVEAEIQTTEVENWALPEEAVVETEGISYALQLVSKKDGYQFKRVPLEVGATHASFLEIRNKNKKLLGATFLTKGAFNLIQ
jgi:membrane fusion protein, heavy metal efflux system